MGAEKPLPRWLPPAHGLGSIAYGVKDNGFSTFLLLFYNQVLGMNPQLVSLALMVALMIDGLFDPLIGYMSDRTYSRWGRRLPWLYLAPIPLGLAWVLLWSATGTPSFWGLVAQAVVVRLLVSCCEVPSVALVPELTRDYDQRTTLMRWRYLFGWGGGLLIMLLAYDVFLADGMLSPEGYRNYGIAGAVLMAGAVLVSAIAQHRIVAQYPPRRPGRFSLKAAFSELIECFSHPAFLVLLAGGALAYTSQGVTFSISNYLYLFIWQFGAEDFSVYPWVLFLSVIASFFTVGPLHKRWGKRDTAVATAVIGAAFWVVPFLLRYADLWPREGTPASTWPLFAMFFCSNLFSVIAMVSASSMMADVVEASEEQTGRRAEGAFFAGNFFMQKCATGLGIFVTGQMLAWAGLPERAKPGEVDPAIIDRLSLAYVAMVTIFAIAIAMVLRRFPITRADHEARVAALGKAARADRDAGGAHP
jgi:GPH family glycoside/pentoside/hexuronide:cation symporter